MPSRPPLLPAVATQVGIAVATAVAYALLGWLSLRLAIAPSPASPVFPPAGIALAAALSFGPPALFGTAVGSFALQFLHAPPTTWTLGAALMPAWIGLGAAAQAQVGRWLIDRHVSQPLTLNEPGDLARFYLFGAAVSTLVNASSSTAMLALAGPLAATDAAATWATWWLGDAIGVLVGAPITLALIGRPRAEWRPRRLVVALPLALACALLVGATSWVVQSHEERLRATFDRDATALADQFDTALRDPQHALLAMQTLFETQQRIEPEEMRRAAAAWLQDQPGLAAIGYSERVDVDALATFESRVRAEGPVADYRVFERADADPTRAAASTPPRSRHGIVAIRFIEPLAANRAALGVDALSIPAARRAIERAAATGDTVATGGFRLTQSVADETGVVLYRALYGGHPNPRALTDEQRRRAFTGVVFVTLRLDPLVAKLLRDAPRYLRGCLVDLDPGAERPRLGGPPGCEAAPPATLQVLRARALGPRAFGWRVEADLAAVPGLGDSVGWLFLVIGLLAAALLGALLLTVSSRQRRIEAAVDARTLELQQAGRALADSEERLRRIVDHAPIGVLYADAGGQVVSINPALRTMLGLPADVAAGVLPRTLQDAVTAPDRERIAGWLQRLAQGEIDRARGQVALERPGAEPTPVRLALSALREPSGAPGRLVGVVEDITEHLQLEASERARQQAEAASRAKSEFVGRMSHELRTPLNAMLGFAQLLGHERTLDPAHQHWARQIQDAGWHLLAMINDTLDLALIESGSLRLRPEPLDPQALVQASMALVASAAERRRVRLLPVDASAGTPPALGDETRSKQVLTNLLSNAVKYNAAGGAVAVTLRHDDSTVRFEVSDDGPGLTAHQAEALFQPFNRLGREDSGVEGTGIGLVISRRLAEMMGGSLVLGSGSGGAAGVRRGATFVLTLPRASGVDPATAPRMLPPEEGQYRRRRVHYVEDNETNVVLMQGMLAQRPQIELSASALGRDALAATRAAPPDLILLDMHLPDMDGLELLRRLKDTPELGRVPVLVLSADATQERIERALAAGACGYLSKPLELQALLGAIDELLEQVDTRWG